MEVRDLDTRLSGLSSGERVALLNDTLEHFQKLGNTAAVCEVLFMLGTEYTSSLELSRGAETYQAAADLFRHSGNGNGEAISYNNLGFIYKELGDTVNALKNYDHALDIYRKAGSKRREALVLSNIGKLYFDSSEYLEAIECFEDALEIAEEMDDNAAVSNYSYNLANSYLKANDHPRALDTLKKSFEVRKTLGDKNGVNAVVKLIAGTYLAMGMSDEAERFVLENAEVIWRPADISDAAEAVQGKGNPDLRKINLSKTVLEVLSRLKSTADSKNINTVFKAESDEVYISTDEETLSNNIDVLITNAIINTDPGKSIYVYISSHEENGRCEIIDEGDDLSKEDVLKIISQAGGNIRHENMMGKGNSFIIET